MVRFKKKKIIIIVLSIIISLLLICISYNMNMCVRDFYRNTNVTKVVLSLSEVKAGLDHTKTKTVVTTEQEEIKEIIDVLHQRTIFKAFPNLGPVSTDRNDRFELRITLTSDSKDLLEYIITSEGHVEIRKGNDDFSNVIVVRGSAT